MKPTNIFRIWLWADLMIGFWSSIFYLIDNKNSNDFGERTVYLFLVAIVIGFLFTIPSIMLLLVFQHYHTKNKGNATDIIKPYLLFIVFINVLYLLPILFMGSTELDTLSFFLLTTFCGFVAFFIEYTKVKKNILSVEIDEIQ